MLKQGRVRVAEKTPFEGLAEYHDTDPRKVNFSWGQPLYPSTMHAPATVAGGMRPEVMPTKD